MSRDPDNDAQDALDFVETKTKRLCFANEEQARQRDAMAIADESADKLRDNKKRRKSLNSRA